MVRTCARFLGRLLLVSGLISLASCSFQGSADSFLRSELSNKGPLALSRNNPYVAANLLVGTEMANNQLVRGFLQYRGAPDAIEVKRNLMQPSRIFFFYLDRPEAYLFEQRGSEWIIKGPETIPPNILVKLSSIPRSSADVPLLIGSTVTKVPRVTSPDAALGQMFTTPVEPLTEAAPLGTQETTPPEFQPGGGGSTVEETPSGDLIHRVSFPGETLRIITTWYTGDVNNTDRIARINGLANPNTLYLDSKILIPRYLLKTTQPLPASEVAERNRAAAAARH